MSRATKKRRPNAFVAFSRTPKGFALIVLVCLALFSIFATKGIDTKALINVIIGAGSGFLVDLVAGLFYTRKRWFSDGGIITGLIVAMVLGSFTSWYVVAATTAIALLSKHLLRVKRKPIFNPAATGLLLSTYLFSSMQSWWGGLSLLNNWYLLLVALGGFLVARRVKKLPQVIAFLVSYGAISLIFLLFKQTSTDALFALENPMLNAALFLAAFMLTDPPTSPTKRGEQIIFGSITGVVSMGVYLIMPSELSYLYIGLLLANLYKWAVSRRSVPKAVVSTRATAQNSL